VGPLSGWWIGLPSLDFRISLTLHTTKNQIHTLSRSSRTDDARYLIWKSCTEKSEAWQAEQKRIRNEANRKRSEAQAGIPKAEARERAATSSGETLRRDYAKEQKAKGATAKAAASKTNRGTVDRMGQKRPMGAENTGTNGYKCTQQ
jgi:hypothetical protein